MWLLRSPGGSLLLRMGSWRGRHLGTTCFHFCSQLCLEFVVKVLDVELVCEALQVGVLDRLAVSPRCGGLDYNGLSSLQPDGLHPVPRLL